MLTVSWVLSRFGVVGPSSGSVLRVQTEHASLDITISVCILLVLLLFSVLADTGSALITEFCCPCPGIRCHRILEAIPLEGMWPGFVRFWYADCW